MQFKNTNFDIIRYANCWEDSSVLLEGLKTAQGGKIFSIASAGDNSFSLLTLNPELIVAGDLNPIQLYLCELKKLAITQLEDDELLAFLGFTDSSQRVKIYKSFRLELHSDAKKYFDQHLGDIEKGIIHAGKFEKYFSLFRKWVLPFIHSKGTTKKLLDKKAEIEQAKFYNYKWNSWRWKLLFKLFYSKKVMGNAGRSPEFMKHVKLNVGEFIYQRADEHLMSVSCQNNEYLSYIFTGKFSPQLPQYLLPENLKKVRANIKNIKFVQGTAEEILSTYGKFDGFNLSDIFEYMSEGQMRENADIISTYSNPNARVAYWNLMVPRRLSESYPTQFAFQKELSNKLHSIDKCFFYNQYIVDQKI
ncbi:MAG: DUF3419 family protein [Bacteroidota bacterium]|nr:DUF3419 family protein [Bacteroidota bacterium]